MIIGISGRAQAGKSSLAKFLQSEAANVKIYSFATPIKEMCVEVLGLHPDNIYGDDFNKQKQTHLKWQEMPGVCCDKSLYDDFSEEAKEYIVYHEPGYMTNREVMEFVGTGLFRKMYADCWIEATFNKIRYDLQKQQIMSDKQFLIPVIDDVRSVNEVEKIQQHGGKVIRLNRDPLMRTSSIERGLDTDKFDWDKFDLVIQNKGMQEDEKNSIALKFVESYYENLKTEPLSI